MKYFASKNKLVFSAIVIFAVVVLGALVLGYTKRQTIKSLIVPSQTESQKIENPEILVVGNIAGDENLPIFSISIKPLKDDVTLSAFSLRLFLKSKRGDLDISEEKTKVGVNLKNWTFPINNIYPDKEDGGLAIVEISAFYQGRDTYNLSDEIVLVSVPLNTKSEVFIESVDFGISQFFDHKVSEIPFDISKD